MDIIQNFGEKFHFFIINSNLLQKIQIFCTTFLFSVAKATLEVQISISLSESKTSQPHRIAPINHGAYHQPWSLLTMEPIDHQAY